MKKGRERIKKLFDNNNSRFEFRIEATLLHQLKKVCDAHYINMSDALRHMVLRIIDGAPCLTETEQASISLKKMEYEQGLLEYLRSKNAEKIHFIRNIRKNLFKFRKSLITLDKADVIQNLTYSRDIAKLREWKHEQQEIERMIRMVSDTNFNMDEIDMILTQVEKDVMYELSIRKVERKNELDA